MGGFGPGVGCWASSLPTEIREFWVPKVVFRQKWYMNHMKQWCRRRQRKRFSDDLKGGLGWVGSAPTPDTQAHGRLGLPCVTQLVWVGGPGCHGHKASRATAWGMGAVLPCNQLGEVRAP